MVKWTVDWLKGCVCRWTVGAHESVVCELERAALNFPCLVFVML